MQPSKYNFEDVSKEVDLIKTLMCRGLAHDFPVKQVLLFINS